MKRTLVLAGLVLLLPTIANADILQWRFTGRVVFAGGANPNLSSIFPLDSPASLEWTLNTDTPRSEIAPCSPMPDVADWGFYPYAGTIQGSFAGLTWTAQAYAEVNLYCGTPSMFYGLPSPPLIAFHGWGSGLTEPWTGHLVSFAQNPLELGPGSGRLPTVPPALRWFGIEFNDGFVAASVSSTEVVPEPGTLYLAVTGLLTAWAAVLRKAGRA